MFASVHKWRCVRQRTENPSGLAHSSRRADEKPAPGAGGSALAPVASRASSNRTRRSPPWRMKTCGACSGSQRIPFSRASIAGRVPCPSSRWDTWSAWPRSISGSRRSPACSSAPAASEESVCPIASGMLRQWPQRPSPTSATAADAGDHGRRGRIAACSGDTSPSSVHLMVGFCAIPGQTQPEDRHRGCCSGHAIVQKGATYDPRCRICGVRGRTLPRADR